MITIRLSTRSLAGTERTLVAVGTARLAVMLVTVRAAAPRSLLTSAPGGGRGRGLRRGSGLGQARGRGGLRRMTAGERPAEALAGAPRPVMPVMRDGAAPAAGRAAPFGCEARRVPGGTP